MPPLTRWMLRLALLYLVVGSGFGAWRLAALAGAVSGAGPLGPLHRDLMFFGWLAHLALGTGYWILPRHPGPEPRGKPLLAWLSLALLSAGIALSALSAGGLAGLPPAVGRSASGLGITGFVWLLWPRVRAFGEFGSDWAARLREEQPPDASRGSSGGIPRRGSAGRTGPGGS